MDHLRRFLSVHREPVSGDDDINPDNIPPGPDAAFQQNLGGLCYGAWV
jgi:hypothetical protein